MKFFDKITNFLDKLDDKQKYLLFFCVLILFFVLNYFLLMQPQIKTLSKISPEIKKISDDIKKVKEDSKKLDQYKEDVGKMKDRLSDLKLKVKSKEEVPYILESISYIANQNGVKIDQIMPATGEKELILENNGVNYFALPISVEARSGYHSLGRFLNQIELEEKMMVHIGGFRVASIENSKRHSVKLTVRAIVYENAPVVKKEKDEKK